MVGVSEKTEKTEKKKPKKPNREKNRLKFYKNRPVWFRFYKPK